VPWTVSAGPVDYADPGVDGHGWLWELQRNDESHRVFVQVSGTAFAVSQGLASDTELAIATLGGSEIEKILEYDELPRLINCTTQGCVVVEQT
jgi:hypothetical protein